MQEFGLVKMQTVTHEFFGNALFAGPNASQDDGKKKEEVTE